MTYIIAEEREVTRCTCGVEFSSPASHHAKIHRDAGHRVEFNRHFFATEVLVKRLLVQLKTRGLRDTGLREELPENLRFLPRDFCREFIEIIREVKADAHDGQGHYLIREQEVEYLRSSIRRMLPTQLLLVKA